MKAILLIILVLVCSILSAINLISENFTSAIPGGWTMTGPSTANWGWSSTNSAGGTSGEIEFVDAPYDTGTFRLISPAFDTSQVHDMNLSFRQLLFDFIDTSTDYTIAVQISTNLVDWNTVWSLTGSSSYGPIQSVVPVSFEYGKSQNTYLAFTFIGYTYDLNYWCIDDVVLSYTNTLGIGTWSAGVYAPTGNVIIPNDYTLILQPGTTLNMGSNTRVDVKGRLLVNGTSSSYVTFTSLSGAQNWKGIEIDDVNASNDSTLINYAVVEDSYESGIHILNSSKVRINNCILRNCYYSDGGGGLYCYNSNIIVENCNFSQNGTHEDGAAAYFRDSSPTVKNNIFKNNICEYSVLCFYECVLTNVQNNYVVNNLFAVGGQFAVFLHSCQGTFQRNLIANNDSGGLFVLSLSDTLSISNCDILNNNSYGIMGSGIFTVSNTIVWGNSVCEIYALSPSSTIITISYSCIENGLGGLQNIASSSYQNSISSNPLFVSPTGGIGQGYDALAADWNLQDSSPCIDNGNPASPPNPDASIEDIGMFYRSLKPLIYKVEDVNPDQGHQIDFCWYRNDKDYTWDPSAWYHVFRQVNSRQAVGENAIVVTNPWEITPDLLSQNRDIYWMDGTRTLYFLGQQKALNRTDYGLIIPTLQDSSSTGLHQETYIVTYFDDVYFWDSIAMSGYSVDNIPPMAATNVELEHTSDTQFNMSWDEVAEGTWEGNSYPEINPITYKIYAGNTPDFAINPSTYLMSTNDTNAVLTSQTASKRFYKIIVSDSE